MPAADISLEDLDTEAMISELRRRGLVLSIWSKEDIASVIAEDDDCDEMSEDEVDRAAELAIAEMARDLENRLSEQGNEIISDRWNFDVRDAVMGAVRNATPGA